MNPSANGTKQKAIRALAVGHVTHDRYAKRIVPGGCAYYASRTWRELGAEVDLLTAVGRDFCCHREMSEGVTVLGVPCDHTTVFTNTYPQEGPRQQWIEREAVILEHAYVSSDAAYELVFLAPVFGELRLREWAGKFRKPQTTVGLGLQGLMKGRDKGPGDRQGGSRVVPQPFRPQAEELAGIDVVFLSAEDLRWCGDEALLPKLREIVPTVVVTLAEKGSVLYLPKSTIQIGVATPTRVVDPTGAGDTYAAAFLFALARGGDPVRAGQFAAVAASIVVEGEGGACLDRLVQASSRAAQVPYKICDGMRNGEGS